MKTFKTTAAQGEISIRKIAKLPPMSDLIEVKPVNGQFIIGHSETGHHHVMTMEKVKVFEAKNPPAGMKILYALLDGDKELTHERPHDTHETIKHDAGVYQYNLGREFDHFAELARKVAD